MRPHVHILMCTKDGSAFLGPQLYSILTQTHRDWSLWISDDGSCDDTLAKIAAFRDAHPAQDIRMFAGPQTGCAQNFLSLLARDGLENAWIAFADQDDLWMPHKLERAIDQISRGTGAEIYASRSIYTDSALSVTGMSTRYVRPFGFGNALVQNVLTGNTLVLPPAVTDFLRSVVEFAVDADIPFHDWWVYQMTTGAGFDVIHDDKPGLFYRQHDRNVLGASKDRSLQRTLLVLRRVFAAWLDQNLTVLDGLSPMLRRPNRQLLFDFMEWRSLSVPRRSPLRSMGIYRQSAGENAVLRVMARIGRI